MRRVESDVRYTVGCVPYLNARPLVHGLADFDVDVVYDVPSRLPALLEKGEAQAILVSSIEALQRPGARVAADLSISSIGEVLSVRLFSKVPFEEIRTLALDQSSMTSNALAQIVLSEVYGASVMASPQSPDLASMLSGSDAGVLIGDNGMRSSAEGLHVLDLGKAWHELTGLPFVWALWVGDEELTPDLAAKLATARNNGGAQLDQIIDREVAEGRWEYRLCRLYLADVMNYELSEDHLLGLKEFGELAVKHGLIEAASAPQIVIPHVPATTN